MPDHPLHATSKRYATSESVRLRGSRSKPANKRAKFAFCLIMLLIIYFCSSGLVPPVRGAGTLYVPSQYPTIQQAVNAASNGDTIQISPGLYREHVVVQDTINGLQIVGNPANPATTIVDGTLNGTVFRLDGTGVTVTGFTVQNAGNGYSAISSMKDTSTNDYHVISNNVIETSQYAISLGLSNSNTVTNNIVTDNSITGIYLEDSDNNIISQNTVLRSVYGIKLIASTGNNINNNEISQTGYGIHISLASTGNTLSFNKVSGQTAGIFINSDSNTAHHNVLTNSDYGIWLYNSKYAQIYYNNVSHASYGIRIQWSTTITPSYHNINNNRIFHNEYGWGIEAVSSNNNTFTGNWLQQNAWGISLSSSAYNTLYRNNFVNNSVQATTNAINIWDKNGNGNYWSDYTGSDANGNGIGDTPRTITPGQDNYPLMHTWSEHDIAVLSISTSANLVAPGTGVDITVKVRNNANISVSESFTVTTKYNSIDIETKTVTDLAQGATQILTFNWNTTGVATGRHTITAAASTVPDELNTGDNNHSDGTVSVTFLGDIDKDGDVDYSDFVILAGAYGSTSGQPAYNPAADSDHDGDVDYSDFVTLAGDYGRYL